MVFTLIFIVAIAITTYVCMYRTPIGDFVAFSIWAGAFILVPIAGPIERAYKRSQNAKRIKDSNSEII